MRNHFPDKSNSLPEPDGSYDKTKWKEIDMSTPQEREEYLNFAKKYVDRCDEEFPKIVQVTAYDKALCEAFRFLLSELKQLEAENEMYEETRAKAQALANRLQKENAEVRELLVRKSAQLAADYKENQALQSKLDKAQKEIEELKKQLENKS